MPNDLISNDPIVARNFYLEIDGQNLVLSGVSGLDIELEVVPLQQNGKNGKQQHIKTLGGALKAPDITITRMAPLSATSDALWKWFKDIRDRSEEHTSELQSLRHLVCRLLLEKKNIRNPTRPALNRPLRRRPLLS